MLALSGVSKAYGRFDALLRVDLEVKRGEIAVLIGPSGSGKSTLLRIIIGLVTPDCGTVCFDGTPVTAANMRSIRLRCGYVIQDGGLFPHLNARDNIILMARYLGRSQSYIDTRLEELAELTRFPRDALSRFPVQLSGGQRQRVSVMRALMLDPDVLLLDEPLGALDPLIRGELQADLRRIFQAVDKTVVLVTHDVGEAFYFADRIVLLRDGRVVQNGPTEQLVHCPFHPFVSQFINARREPSAGVGEMVVCGDTCSLSH